MRKISWMCVLLFGAAANAIAQQPTPTPKWEASGSVGLVEARPGDNQAGWDNWYAQGRYAAAIGYYWTPHLKTELEYALSGEGARYVQEYVRVGGTSYPYSFESFHRLQQTSLRMTWQFRDNAWLHPYLSAGIVVDAERQTNYVPPQYLPPGSQSNEFLLRGSLLTPANTVKWRSGVAVGGGAKFYMSTHAFFNAAALATISKPASTISLIAGFGVDF
jgi:opacity protein-like surface antigen